MSNLDRTNVDAMHWAEQFCQHRIDNGWTMEDIDEGLMVGWFANYRFCVQDPLTDRIEKLEKEKEALREAPLLVFGWLYAYCCNALDEGIDIRHVEVPEIHAEYKRDVLEKGDDNEMEMKVYEIHLERNYLDKPDITTEIRAVTADSFKQVTDSLAIDFADEALEVIAIIKRHDICERLEILEKDDDE
jgi:hypothetical protein